VASQSSAYARPFRTSLRSSEASTTIEMVDASLFCAAPIPYQVSNFKLATIELLSNTKFQICRRYRIPYFKSEISNLKYQIAEDCRPRIPARPPNAQAADAPRQSSIEHQLSNLKLPKIAVLEFPARSPKRASRRCAAPTSQLSNIKFQICRLERFLNPCPASQTRKWLKISGGGGTQPYSSTHRIRACPAIPLASV